MQKIHALRNKERVEAVIDMAQMPKESVYERFGIHEASSKGAATMLGAVISKFGSQIDRKVAMSNLVNKNQKKIEAGGFNRLGLASKAIDEDLKVEQTQMMVQSLFNSKPMLFRRYAPTKSLGTVSKKVQEMGTRPSRTTKATIPMSTATTQSNKSYHRPHVKQQGTQESASKDEEKPKGIFDLANVESESLLEQQTAQPMLEIRPVNVEAIYSNAERDRDIGKMKKYFETKMNPMQRLAS